MASRTWSTHTAVGWWLGAAVLSALAYLVALPLQPYPFSVLTKMLPCLSLSVACWLALEGITRHLMVAATLLSALADAAITVAFEAGLAIFLLVQLTYAALFFRHRRPWPQQAWLVGLVALFLVAALFLLVPRAGNLALPVAIYITAISVMVMLAARYEGSVLVAVGALSFMFSDTVIGVNRFWVPWELATAVIMSSYYLGQILIAVGVVQSSNQAGSS